MSIELNKNNFDSTIMSEGLVLVDFWAAWCMPCKMLAPTLAKLEQQPDIDIKVCSVNVDVEQELAMRFSIASIPTIIIFRNGSMLKRIMGNQPLEALVREIKRLDSTPNK